MKRPTPEEKRQWEDEGYLVFENAIQGDELKRLQSVFDHWATKCKDIIILIRPKTRQSDIQ